MDPEDVMDVLTEHPKFKPVMEALEPYDRKELGRLLQVANEGCDKCAKLANQVSDLEDLVEEKKSHSKTLEDEIARLEAKADGLLVKTTPSPLPLALVTR